ERTGLVGVGGDLQGPDDDRGGHRPAGASLRDPGAEHPQLPSGAGEEGEAGPDAAGSWRGKRGGGGGAARGGGGGGGGGGGKARAGGGGRGNGGGGGGPRQAR